MPHQLDLLETKSAFEFEIHPSENITETFCVT